MPDTFARIVCTMEIRDVTARNPTVVKNIANVTIQGWHAGPYAIASAV